jgi:hypothetical protein
MTDLQSIARSKAKWWELFYDSLGVCDPELPEWVLDLAARYEEEGLRPETAAMVVEREMRNA